ncbi:chorismate mutase [Legionella qingyii]|uniref:chorismate mutase n=1 Tax=Legionella qingyii TaxID=2184757 RepID=A0A317U3T6_9GAMM|nr:chorismate mutase [Legionella qingyii]PWY55895.1 chorismate mutase [Legionella qingyii]RUR22471.1 chorismate mutase [Legionella qingyii]RUR27943.1 chorismate mutase [Legionella qingyii]
MSTIEQLREQIQNIDHDIIRYIALRQDLCKKMGTLIRKEGKQIIDLEQEKKNLEFYESLSNEYSIDPKFVSRLFKLIIINSRV